MRVEKTRLQVWWHCLVRTFEDEPHAYCTTHSIEGVTLHHCMCGYGLPSLSRGRRITTLGEIRELLLEIDETSSHGGNIGMEEAWSMIYDLMEAVLRGIADCAISDPAALAREALKALDLDGLNTLLSSAEPTRYRVVGVDDEQLEPMLCRVANGLYVTDPTPHGEDCRCTFLELQDG